MEQWSNGVLGSLLQYSSTPLLLVFLRSHQGKENHVSNRPGARQNHHHPVDSDSEAAGRGHPVFEGPDEVLVHRLSLLVAHGALLHLILESRSLVDRIV